MARDEILKKLKSIKRTAHPTVMTYDMGLQFDIMDSTGAETNLGNVGNWPLWKFYRLSQKQIDLLKVKINNKDLSVSDFEGIDFEPFIKTILSQYQDIKLYEVFKDIENYPFSDEQNFFFIYCDTKSWDFELKMFATEEEITDYFYERFAIYTKWEDYNDDELSSFLEEIEENGEGVCFYTVDNEE